tara:strand:+ start:95 stop:544 length:450 start_codon:yes stop_codon:yes gene_type:complete
MKEEFQLNEGRFIDSAILLVLTTKLLKPIKSWKAFKLGLIDEDGKVLREPINSQEKNSFTMLDKFLLKIKIFLLENKFVGSLFSYYIIIKEQNLIQDNSVEYLVEERNKERRIKDLHLKIKNEILKEGFTEEQYLTILTNIKIKKQLMD